MLTIEGKRVQALHQLSHKTHMIMLFIPQSGDWFRHTVAQESLVISVENEDHLLSTIQTGLHTDHMIRLLDFQLPLDHFFTMSEEEVKSVALYFQEKIPVDHPRMQAILDKFDLIPYYQLSMIDDVLENWSLKDFRIFQSFTIWDRMAIYRCLKMVEEQQTSADVINAARNNAIELASTVHEFEHWFIGYLHVIKPGQPYQGFGGHETFAPIFHPLQPLIFQLLFTPTIPTGLSDQQVLNHLPVAIQNSQFVGYEQPAQAFHHLARNLDFIEVPAEELPTIIDGFLKHVRTLILQGELEAIGMSQDGNNRYFQANNGEQKVGLSLSRDGYVTLRPEFQL